MTDLSSSDGSGPKFILTKKENYSDGKIERAY